MSKAPGWFEQGLFDLQVYCIEVNREYVEKNYDHIKRLACYVHAHLHSEDLQLAKLPLVAFSMKDIVILGFMVVLESITDQIGLQTYPAGLPIACLRFGVSEEPWLFEISKGLQNIFPYSVPDLVLGLKTSNISFHLSRSSEAQTDFHNNWISEPVPKSKKVTLVQVEKTRAQDTKKIHTVYHLADEPQTHLPIWPGGTNIRIDRCIYDPHTESELFFEHSDDSSQFFYDAAGNPTQLALGFRAIVTPHTLVARRIATIAEERQILLSRMNTVPKNQRHRWDLRLLAQFDIPPWFKEQSNIANFVLYNGAWIPVYSEHDPQLLRNPCRDPHLRRLINYVHCHLTSEDIRLARLPIVSINEDDTDVLRFLYLLAVRWLLVKRNLMLPEDTLLTISDLSIEVDSPRFAVYPNFLTQWPYLPRDLTRNNLFQRDPYMIWSGSRDYTTQDRLCWDPVNEPQLFCYASAPKTQLTDLEGPEYPYRKLNLYLSYRAQILLPPHIQDSLFPLTLQ